MLDWTDITNDPLSDAVRRQFEAYVREVSSVVDQSLLAYFRDSAAGHDVLHIGCCEHDESYMARDGWKHRAMAEVTRSILGVDINERAVEAMRRRGFEVALADATSDIDLGRRFDRVILGDVIEHVGDLQGLLRFADRHLSPGGRLIVSTPNPFFVGNIRRAWFAHPMIANFEHVCWVTESNMIELARRVGMQLCAIHYPVGNSSRNRAISWLKKVSYRPFGTALFTTNVYVIEGSVGR